MNHPSLPFARPVARTPFRSFQRALRGALALGLGLFAASAPLQAAGDSRALYLLTEDGKLVTAPANDVSLGSVPLAITGVTAGETLVAIDVRPNNQRLYALGVNEATETATLYHVSPETGLAAVVGTAASTITFTTDGATLVDLPNPATTAWDIDFNPAVDRLRVVAGSVNFRVNPNTGAPVDGDNGGAAGSVIGTNPDGTINGAATSVGGAAYTNNQPNNGAITTLYTLDSAGDVLCIQNPPNAGAQSSALALSASGSPLDLTRVRGFDISPGVNAGTSSAAVGAGSGLVLADDASAGAGVLYSVDLTTGAATQLGQTALSVRSMAIRTSLGAAICLNGAATELFRFDPANPSQNFSGTQTATISGVTSGEVLAGIDSRPATGQLYGFGVNATANTATLYLIDPQTGACTAVGTPGQIALVDDLGSALDLPDPTTTGYGMDFNPTVDRIRIVTNSGLNFRLNPSTGAPVDGNVGVGGVNPDGALNGGSTAATAIAYTNNFGGATATTQYAFDSAAGNLYIQNPPNTGTLSFAGQLSNFNFRQLGGFDIPPSVKVDSSGTVASGTGYLLAGNPGFVVFYTVDLSSGSYQTVGFIGTTGATASGLVVWAAAPAVVVTDASNNVFQYGATVDFGGVVVGKPMSLSFTVFNGGSQALNFAAALDGGAAFSITQGALGEATGSSPGTVTVSFNPPDLGVFSDTLRIASNDPNVPSFDLTLSGTGLAPAEIDVESPVGTVVQDNAATVNFGTYFLNEPLTRTIKVKNLGDEALSYSTSLDSGSSFSVTQNDSGSVPGKGAATLTITFSPGATGSLSDTLHITSNDADEASFEIALSGVGRERLTAPLTTVVLVRGATPTGAGTAGGPPADARLSSFEVPAIDATGRLAYVAAWSRVSGVFGGRGLFSDRCLAKVGDPVTGLARGKYATFSDPVMDEAGSGRVATVATFSGLPLATSAGVVSFAADGTPTLVAQKGTVAAPGGAKFKSFKEVAVSGSATAVLGQLLVDSGSPKVTLANDIGVWVKDGAGPLTLVLREGQMVGTRKIKTLTSLMGGNGSPGQGRGWLRKTAGGVRVLARAVFTDLTQGILLADPANPANPVLIAESGPVADGAPAVTGATFASFSVPAINGADANGFLATMTTGQGGVTDADAKGIFLRSGLTGSYALVAQLTLPAGATGAKFSVLKDPVIGSDGGVAFPATIAGGGVSGLAATTLWWKPAGGSLTLVAQGGKRPGPDLPAAMQWKSFPLLAIAAPRGPVFTGNLVVGKGGVTLSTARGAWAVDYTGAARLLMRTGDKINLGNGRPLKTLQYFNVIGASVGGMGLTRSLNDNGLVVWRANFTDGSQAIMTSEVP